MRKDERGSYEQCYNAQVVVDADGSYASESEVKVLEARSMKLYVNVCAEAPRKHDFRPAVGEPKQPSPTAETDSSRAGYTPSPAGSAGRSGPHETRNWSLSF